MYEKRHAVGHTQKLTTFLGLHFRDRKAKGGEVTARGPALDTSTRVKAQGWTPPLFHAACACIVLKCEKSGGGSATRLPGYFSVEAAHASISKAAVPPTSTGTAVGGKYSKSLSTLPSTSGIRPMRLLSFFERKVDTIGKMTLVIT